MWTRHSPLSKNMYTQRFTPPTPKKLLRRCRRAKIIFSLQNFTFQLLYYKFTSLHFSELLQKTNPSSQISKKQPILFPNAIFALVIRHRFSKNRLIFITDSLQRRWRCILYIINFTFPALFVPTFLSNIPR